jgi:hypothetical protein
LASCWFRQYTDRSRSYTVPGARHYHITDEYEQENHNPDVLRRTVTVSYMSLYDGLLLLMHHRDIVASSVQMAYLHGFTSSNPTKDLWEWTLVTQIIECITILTSCVPYLRPLLESVPSGLYGSDELRRRGTFSEHGYSRSKNSSYQLSSSASKAGGGTRHSRKSQVEGSGLKRFLPMLSHDKTTHANSASGIPGGPRRPDGGMDVEITAVHHKSGDEKRWDDKRWETASTGSHSKILKTTVVSAEWEEVEIKRGDASSDEIGILR